MLVSLEMEGRTTEAFSGALLALDRRERAKLFRLTGHIWRDGIFQIGLPDVVVLHEA